MSLVWPLLLVISTFLVSSTVAMDRCHPNTIAAIRSTRECYVKRRPPPLVAPEEVTYVLISANELSTDTKCIKTHQDSNKSYVTTYWKKRNEPTNDNRNFNQINGEFILETDASGNTYRLYVIHNDDHVYSYYKCFLGMQESDGVPVVAVAIGCNHINDEKANKVLSDAKKCFQRIGIKDSNYVQLEPCDCK